MYVTPILIFEERDGTGGTTLKPEHRIENVVRTWLAGRIARSTVRIDSSDRPRRQRTYEAKAVQNTGTEQKQDQNEDRFPGSLAQNVPNGLRCADPADGATGQPPGPYSMSCFVGTTALCRVPPLRSVGRCALRLELLEVPRNACQALAGLEKSVKGLASNRFGE